MRYSLLFGKTKKLSKEFESVNATLLLKAGYINMTTAGVYTYLPLGLKVLKKIEDIVRKEMNTVAQEILMPSMSPVEFWKRTGRLDTFDCLFKAVGANELSKTKNSSEYVLNATHEEIVTPLAKDYIVSYKQLPFCVYQIQTKFRNEPRAKSGLLRGREFRMKDAYSFHTTTEDMIAYYDNMKTVYKKIYDNLGIGEDTYIVKASGGEFTKNFSHEYQTKCETGEDTIYLDKETGECVNFEVVDDPENPKYEKFKSSEVGNIFPLETKYSDSFDFNFVDEKGQKKKVVMGCYGIGISRVMGVIVEKFHDEKGIVWPKEIAPFSVHLVGLNMDDKDVKAKAEEIYKQLMDKGVEVLFDDRVDAGTGEKFGDADLIGIPLRVIVSKKTLNSGDVFEVKKRNEQDSKMLSLEEIIKTI
jgi:prolyl-tRNA synthetase